MFFYLRFLSATERHGQGQHLPITMGCRCANFREGGKTRGKILIAQERSTVDTQLAHERTNTRLGSSGERHNTLQGQINFHQAGVVQIFLGGGCIGVLPRS